MMLMFVLSEGNLLTLFNPSEEVEKKLLYIIEKNPPQRLREVAHEVAQEAAQPLAHRGL